MEHFCPSWCKYFRLCFAFNKALLCSDNKFVTILTTFDSRCIHYNNRTKNNSGKLTRAPIMRNSHFVLIYNCLAYEETVEVLTQTVWRRNSESEMEKQSWRSTPKTTAKGKLTLCATLVVAFEVTLLRI